MVRWSSSPHSATLAQGNSWQASRLTTSGNLTGPVVQLQVETHIFTGRRCIGEQFLKVNKQIEITILAVDFCCSWNIPKTCVFFNFTQVLCLNLSRIFVYLLSNVWFRFHQGVKVCKHRENFQPLRNQAAGLHVVRVELFNNSFQGWHPRFHQVTWRICQASISRRSLNKQPTQGFKGWFTAVDSSEMKWKVDVWYVVQLPCYFECIYICHWFFSRIWKNKDFVVCFVFFVHSKFVHIISPPQVFFPWIPIHCISSKGQLDKSTQPPPPCAVSISFMAWKAETNIQQEVPTLDGIFFSYQHDMICWIFPRWVPQFLRFHMATLAINFIILESKIISKKTTNPKNPKHKILNLKHL